MFRFTEEEMTNDPPLPEPEIVIKTDDEVPDTVDVSVADTWFNKHKNTRVPMIALEDDLIKIKDQNFACFSVIRPEDYGVLHHKDKEYHGSLIKFRGVFRTREEAERHIKKTLKIDKHFDIHLVPAFRWAGMGDDDAEENEYADQKIANIMKGYFVNENNRIKDIRARIASAEEGNIRSEEVSEFWEKANQEAEEKYRRYQERLTAPVEDTTFSTTLEEMVQELDIKAAPRAVLSKNLDAPVSRDTIRSVVSEIILDEEADDKDKQISTVPVIAEGCDELDPEP